jgi:hypothetical protein
VVTKRYLNIELLKDQQMAQHMNAAQTARPRHFADVALSLCAEFGEGSAIPASCLRGFYGVSFLMGRSQTYTFKELIALQERRVERMSLAFGIDVAMRRPSSKGMRLSCRQCVRSTEGP